MINSPEIPSKRGAIHKGGYTMNEAAKQAKREYMREYRKNNADKIREAQQRFYKKNPGKQAEYQERYWERVAEKQKEGKL